MPRTVFPGIIVYMKKGSSFPLTVLFVTMLSITVTFFPQTASALEVTISPNGTISFFDDGVLGESTSPLVAQRNATKVIQNQAGNRVQIQATDKAVEVGVENRRQANAVTPGTTASPSTQQIDQTEVQRLRAQFPAQVTRVHMQNMAEDSELEVRSEYQRQLLEERSERTDNVEVRSKLDASGSQELEVRSKSAAAQLKGAEFTVEPETNVITITTPSGQEKVLNHLPDQALERIRQNIRLQNTEAGTPDFSIKTNEQNQLIYRTQGTKQKKFLGLFNRDIEAEVVLNDETGEVTEVEKPSVGILGQFLDAFSF